MKKMTITTLSPPLLLQAVRAPVAPAPPLQKLLLLLVVICLHAVLFLSSAGAGVGAFQLDVPVSTRTAALSQSSIITTSLNHSKSLQNHENDANDANGVGGVNVSPRRSFMTNFLATATGLSVLSSSCCAFPSIANANNDSSPLVDVYFGVGCYWHIQHEFVEAERNLLKRSDDQLTSRTGYAGGTATDKEGRVCYHNLMSVADYGKLGHGEVVGMTIPQSSIGDFAIEYFNLFTSKGERVDPMDRGSEYRSLLGLPGGMKNEYYKEVEKAALEKGMTLVMGKGNDPDTLGTKQVYVYDTAKFPFYQAEVYHQFHNDFQSPPYGKKYNDLQKLAFDDGRLKITGCPDKV